MMKTLKTLVLALILVLPASLLSAYKAAPGNIIDKITAPYLGLKDALATGKSTDAQSNAKQLLAVLSDSPDKGLSADQKKLMDSYLDKLKFDSRHISESTDIDHQREHFASLSKNLYEMVKGLKMNSSNLYLQYCPMKKAYWLSLTQTIKNPYYSDKMMATCGSVKATLSAVK